jgi:hypothetical protein
MHARGIYDIIIAANKGVQAWQDTYIDVTLFEY